VASKRHHYVPQFYLNYFCSEGASTLWVYEKGSARPRSQTPYNTAVEGGLYALTVDGRKDDLVERNLSEIESVTKPILDRWQQHGALPLPEEIMIVVQFLALLHVRVPRMIATIEEAMEITAIEGTKLFAERQPDVIREIVRSRPPAQGIDAPTPEEFLDSIRNLEKHFKVVVNREASVAESFKLAPRLVRELHEMEWWLCDAPPGKFLITSDTPLCAYVPTSETKGIFGSGLGLKNVELSFPISPRVCLLLHRHGGGERRGRFTSNIVRCMNARMVTTAERFVFSPQQSSRVARLIRASRPQQPKLDRNVFGSETRRRLRSRLKLD
jgi:Protein of unknown function (DUF4238)